MRLCSALSFCSASSTKAPSAADEMPWDSGWREESRRAEPVTIETSKRVRGS